MAANNKAYNMKKLLIIITIILVCVIGMVTNPLHEAHVDKAMYTVFETEMSDRSIINVTFVDGFYKPLLRHSLKVNNYLIFSISHIEGKNVGLGIFNQIIPLADEKDLTKERELITESL